METRANYVLIGAFTLAGLVGLLAFFLWFARLELDRQYAYYDVVFPTVAGLSNASDVRFSGLPVGRVVDVRLSPEGDGTVRVRLEIAAGTPVRTDSLASVESQGVTGVAFVGITAGSPDAPLLAAVSPDEVPRIEAGRSVLQSLSEDAPALLNEALNVMQEIGRLVGDENRGRLDRILANVESASDEFATALADFSEVAGSVGAFSEEIGRFNTTLDRVTAELELVLSGADDAVASVTALSEEGRAFVATGSDTLLVAQDTLERTGRFVDETLTASVADLRAALEDIRAEAQAVGARAGGALESVDTAALTANARLEEARATLEAVDALIARVDGAAASIEDSSRRVGALVDGAGGELVTETRAAVAQATDAFAALGSAAREDLPAIMADVREAAAAVSRVVDEVGGDLTEATGRIGGLADGAEATLAAAADTFARANETLAVIDGALATGEQAMAAAERAFSGADRVIAEDLEGIVTQLETTLADLRGAVGTVSEQVPGITGDLRDASAAAERAFVEFERAVTTTGGAVEQFATTGLPLYTRLAGETRTLIENLNRLTVQIQRDPGRFLLDRQSPEFRR